MHTLIFIFACAVSAACFWMSIKLIRLHLRAKNWQRVNAMINSKEVILHPKYSTPKAPYGLKVDYSYKIDNKTYTARTVYLAELAGGQVNMMKSDAEKRLAKINPEMPVLVNPADPAQSLMYNEGIGIYLLIFFFGILSFLIGLVNFLS